MPSETLMTSTLPTIVGAATITRTVEIGFGRRRKRRKRKYKVHRGKRGGRYIIRNGRKVYL